MSRSTVFLARSIGLFTIFTVLGILIRGSAIIEATVADGPLMFSYALISLAAGVALMVGHNVWSGGALPVVVTAVGWLVVAKGLLLLLLTPEALTGSFGRIGIVPLYVNIDRDIPSRLVVASFCASAICHHFSCMR